MLGGFNINLDYFSITLLLGGFTALLSGFVVFIHNRKKSENIAWLLSNLTSAIWSFGYFVMINSKTHDLALWSNWILHMASIYIPVCYFLSIAFITDTYQRYKRQILVSALFGFVFLMFVPTAWYVRDVIPKAHFNFVCDAGPLYIYYTIYFFLVVLYALSIVLRKLTTETNPIQIQRYKYIILFTIFGFAGGGSVFFLTFNIPILPYPLILFALYPAVSGYAIFRYQLFDVKVIATELLVFIIWIAFLVRIITSTDNSDRYINITLLLFMIVAGIFLIRSVIKEIQLRENIQKLATDLETVNRDLEKANDRLKSLDQLKSEFLSLATHQIRGPLTAIKGYASLILDGDYGKITEKTKGAVQVIFNSTQNLVVIVNEFLDISRIEQGRMKYDLTTFDVQQLLTDIVTELKPNLDKAGLLVDFDIEKDENYIVNADMGKLKQVIGNLIDNSIKYTPHGGIVVGLRCDSGKIRITIKDTGIGIAPDDIPKLFGKFSRAKDAFRTNVIGTGLGLYVAKQMIEAQGGRVWVESAGVGKGSTFYIELPENK